VGALGEQPERNRRIAALTPATSDASRLRIEVFLQALEQLGWGVGRNLQFDERWPASVDELRRQAAELAAAAPDVILASTNQALAYLLQATHVVPIVFVIAIDPVGDGNVASLSRPGGNATGFLLYEYSIGTKWVELLHQLAPAVTRVAVLRDPATTAGIGQFAAIQAVAPPFKVELIPVNVRDGAEIERAITAFAREPNGGLIVTGSVAAVAHSKLITLLASRHKLPSVYAFRQWVADSGGLISYGPDLNDQYRHAASYVDRVLKGEKPANLPVQAPTKYELVINLKTAKQTGIAIPASLLARADEVIE
jgi:putative ABC transport system substrate-binding protein